MKSCLNLCLGALGSMAALASMNASAHGWVEYPNARQNICYEDGGIWNNSIPNAACQAAFDKSGAYPFVQRNEVAALVPGYRDMSQVMATVKDGELCGASDPAKAGLNVPSPHWQKTKLALDGNNRFELVFNATAPHNPSYWEFYLSKPEYDDTRPLTWADLDLVSTSDNVAVGADKKYRIKVTLPAGREGSAILFTRWQRIDAAGEGFYNCSDITFSDEKSTEPTEPKPNLEALGYLVQQGFGPVAPGDTIRFRTFNENGTEQQDISLAITARNLNTKIWSAELAGQFNSLTSGNWFIGIWHDEMSHYMFDSKNIFANQVHAPAAKFSYQLSLIKGDVTPPPTPPTPPTPPVKPDGTWSSTAVYKAKDTVVHNGKEWTAQWWTQGEEPGTTGQWGVWRTKQTDDAKQAAWSATATYNAKDTVMHNGKEWTAQWWTQGEEPGTTGEWGVWR